jgi:hypothetical protein
LFAASWLAGLAPSSSRSPGWLTQSPVKVNVTVPF